MILYLLASLTILATQTAALQTILDQNGKAHCNRWGYWGDHCDTACSVGCKPVVNETANYEKIKQKIPTLSLAEFQILIGTKACEKDSVYCLQDAPACSIGWTNLNEYHRCDVPLCFGDHGCDHQGICIEPDYCICGDSGAQIVGLSGDYTYPDPSGKSTHTFTGIQCVSLRAQGIKGAFIAMCVVFMSVSTCGFIAEKRRYNEKGSKAYLPS